MARNTALLEQCGSRLDLLSKSKLGFFVAIEGYCAYSESTIAWVASHFYHNGRHKLASGRASAGTNEAMASSCSIVTKESMTVPIDNTQWSGVNPL